MVEQWIDWVWSFFLTTSYVKVTHVGLNVCDSTKDQRNKIEKSNYFKFDRDNIQRNES